LPSYRVVAADTLHDLVTLTFDLLTLVSGHTWRVTCSTPPTSLKILRLSNSAVLCTSHCVFHVTWWWTVLKNHKQDYQGGCKPIQWGSSKSNVWTGYMKRCATTGSDIRVFKGLSHIT